MLLEIGRVRRDERVVLAECDRSFVDNHGCGCVVATVSCNNNHQVEVRAAAAVAKQETTFAINMTTKKSSNDCGILPIPCRERHLDA